MLTLTTVRSWTLQKDQMLDFNRSLLYTLTNLFRNCSLKLPFFNAQGKGEPCE
jgi:hypothetical protein